MWLLTCLFWVGLRIVYARAVICGCRSAGQCVGVLCLSVCFVFLSLFFCWLVVIFLVCARACLVVSVCVRCACASVCVCARAFVCVACLCVCACGWFGALIFVPGKGSGPGFSLCFQAFRPSTGGVLTRGRRILLS